jgi:hypothetical protein
MLMAPRYNEEIRRLRRGAQFRWQLWRNDKLVEEFWSKRELMEWLEYDLKNPGHDWTPGGTRDR